MALGTDAGAVPSRLLDDYVARVGYREHGSLASTALRTGSVAARHLLARTVGPGALDDLLAEARGQAPAGTFPMRRRASAALTNLARVLALQNALPSDRRDGLALFDMALRRFGVREIGPIRQGQHAQLALHLGERTDAAELCRQYPDILPQVRTGLVMDLANPFAGPDGDELTWLRQFQGFFPAPGPVLADGGDNDPFDRVTIRGVTPVTNGELISVIVTTYRPGVELITSVTSLLQQSWMNLEILIIDDGSPAEHEPVLTKCVGLDSRVRLRQLSDNRGTYLARNVGLDAARGTIIAFQDSDDWSHPLRLEHQARPLLEEASVVATLSDGLRATPDLLVSTPGHRPVSTVASSLMFRRDPVMRRIGYFDRVRKAADTEYRRRIVAAFGEHAVRHVGEHPYALIRLWPDSLSRSDFRGGNWMHPARAAYRSAYTHWHDQIRRGRASPHLARSPAHRPFPAPAHVEAGAPAERCMFDVVFVGDWRGVGHAPRAACAEMRALAQAGVRVAVLHLESFRHPSRERAHLWPPIQALVNDGVVAQVLLDDDVHASLVIVRQPAVLQFPPLEQGGVRGRQVVIQVDEAPHRRDGDDRTYCPQGCAATAQRMFGAAATWWCPGPQVRQLLAGSGSSLDLAADAPPSVMDADRRWRPRTAFRSDRPVIGHLPGLGASAWPADRDTLLAAYPCLPDIDVRLRGDAGAALALLGGRLPTNWLVYADGDIDVRSFLHQIDFYVYFPHPARVETDLFPLREAMAAGCVVICPPAHAAVFGEAAVYCQPAQVRDAVTGLHADPAAFVEQSRRAVAWAARTHPERAYVDYVTSVLAHRGGQEEDPR
jgi:O-antigen biosynthesis protein